MTRQDIDTIISIICPNDEDFEKACISPAYLKNELEILALDQEPCDDAISRQSMLDYIKYLHGEMPEEEFVKALPSVTPARKKEWIPVTERLPEDRREVLVTAYWHETYQVMMGSYFGDGLWWCVPFNNSGEHMQKLKPKAWMPLPEPYREERTEE